MEAFDIKRRMGLWHIAFPLKMMPQPDGHPTSCDILHPVAASMHAGTGVGDRTLIQGLLARMNIILSVRHS
ncbi:MAG: hypothetical protein ABSB41_05850 [Anaerolineales bacterium]